jgi:hypothetical protein
MVKRESWSWRWSLAVKTDGSGWRGRRKWRRAKIELSLYRCRSAMARLGEWTITRRTPELGEWESEATRSQSWHCVLVWKSPQLSFAPPVSLSSLVQGLGKSLDESKQGTQPRRRGLNLGDLGGRGTLGPVRRTLQTCACLAPHGRTHRRQTTQRGGPFLGSHRFLVFSWCLGLEAIGV